MVSVSPSFFSSVAQVSYSVSEHRLMLTLVGTHLSPDWLALDMADRWGWWEGLVGHWLVAD